MVLSSTVFAIAETGWDFSGDRVPSDDDFAVEWQEYPKLECQDRLDLLYRSYIQKHPDFLEFKDKPEIRQEWLSALAQEHLKRGQDFLSHCVYETISTSLWDYGEVNPIRSTPVFCGVAGENSNKRERSIARQLELLTDLTMKGGLRAIDTLFIHSDVSPLFRLNPDIRFYIAEKTRLEIPDIVAKYEGTKFPYVVRDHETGLSKERMAEIRDAVKRDDPSVVFNEWTTCVKVDL